MASLIATGCATTYNAERLPSNLRIASQSNTQEIGLSQLASSGVSNDVISAGDSLEVTIAAGLDDDDTVTLPVRVAEDGTASLPYIGPIPVAGLEPPAAEAAIHAACIQRQLYRDPHVNVQIESKRMNTVVVIGAVKEPGEVMLPRNSSHLLAAIVRAGGLAEDAGENVEIRNPIVDTSASPYGIPFAGRSNGTGNLLSVGHSSGRRESGSPRMSSVKVNLVSAAKEGTKGYVIEDGGVVIVEKRDPVPISVLGLVRKPGLQELPVNKDYRLLDAIATAGGVSYQVADKIYVIRANPRQAEPAVIRVSLRKSKHSANSNLLLGPGDIVSVEQTLATVLMDALQIIRFGVSSSFALF